MTGVFTDNQPDFSWLMPYEEKSFTQYFLPYQSLGLVKNATKDILLNIEKQDKELLIKIFATSLQKGNTINILSGDQLLLRETFDASPEHVYSRPLAVDKGVTEKNISVSITDASGKEILVYEPAKDRENEIPLPAAAAKLPAEIENNEQLFLTGMHLEQYRHATYSPVSYYEEALRRNSKDIRNNNALGAWYLRKGQFAKAESHFRTGIETMVQRNPNPYDGELYYNLGLCLKLQDKPGEAYDAFFKACWNSGWQDSGYFSLAQIDMAKGDFEKALVHIQKSLDRNAGNSKAHALQLMALRKTGQHQVAIEIAGTALNKDVFNLTVYFETYKNFEAVNDIPAAQQSLDKLKTLARRYVHNYIGYALEYAAAGLYEDASEFLQLHTDEKTDGVYPMVWYYLASWQQRCGNSEKAKAYYEKGSKTDAGLCFPNRLDDIAILQEAIANNPADAKAPYYLGNLWYDKRQYNEAIAAWELSAKKDIYFPTVFRNLGIAYFNKKNDRAQAQQYYEKAFLLDTTDARVLMELDQLYKRINRDTHQRLHYLELHLPVVKARDDLYLERAALYNFTGEYKRAYELIMHRRFHPWEGGEGKVSGQYIYSLVEMAKLEIEVKQPLKAIALLEQAQSYPVNLGEGKLFGTAENDIFYWLGVACEKKGEPGMALNYFKRATEGPSEPAAAMFYNDRPADKIFYQGLAWQELGEREKAILIFLDLIEYGNEHLNDEIKIDYFAVSLPNLLIFEDDLDLRNQVHCNYIAGLGHLGLGHRVEAINSFEKVLTDDNMHFGAKTHLAMAKQLREQKTIITAQS
jgi:tetratricopeptide (TPR) repeat protein